MVFDQYRPGLVHARPAIKPHRTLGTPVYQQDLRGRPEGLHGDRDAPTPLARVHLEAEETRPRAGDGAQEPTRVEQRAGDAALPGEREFNDERRCADRAEHTRKPHPHPAQQEGDVALARDLARETGEHGCVSQLDSAAAAEALADEGRGEEGGDAAD